jgi:hypothetical protein
VTILIAQAINAYVVLRSYFHHNCLLLSMPQNTNGASAVKVLLSRNSANITLTSFIPTAQSASFLLNGWPKRIIVAYLPLIIFFKKSTPVDCSIAHKIRTFPQ